MTDNDPHGFLTWGNGEKIGGIVGVGPWVEEHPGEPLPEDPRYDPELLAAGDRRNVTDRFRYWSVEAIHAELEKSRSALHIAIENLEHDLNIGSIVRTGNAFNVGGVHIVGRRKWNRRGALVTDRYLNIYHRPDAAALAQWAAEAGYTLVAVDNTGDTEPIETAALPQKAVLVFGQESVGISDELRAVCPQAVYIPQYGSTRSLNVAAAAAIAQHEWVRQHRPLRGAGGAGAVGGAGGAGTGAGGSAPTKTIHVVGAVFCRDAGERGTQILAAQRGPGKNMAGYWEFPGGKVEPGESPQEALAREIREELLTEAEVEQFVGRGIYDYPFGRVVLDAYFCDLVGPKPQLIEHVQARWLGVEELGDVQWAPADLPILAELRRRLSAG
ncbi:TrmH family RNA methyltransferase [Campylobacter upsaliensis]|uniref:TrmH family RNA methyltransferase n=1 Tax=Trueperella sp. TaxID=2699835 RepID=UPI0022EB4007